MQLLMLNTMFLGGLKEEICNQVLEEGPTQPDESVKAPREIESILNDKRRDKGIVITSIEDTDSEDRMYVGEVDKEEANHLNAVHAVLRHKGCPQYRFWLRPRGGSQRGSDGTGPWDGSNGIGAIICLFCNKPGHRIAQCHAKAASQQGQGFKRKTNCRSGKFFHQEWTDQSGYFKLLGGCLRCLAPLITQSTISRHRLHLLLLRV
jgi:hypothetical protein